MTPKETSALGISDSQDKAISFSVELAPELCPTFCITKDVNGKIMQLIEVESNKSVIEGGQWNYGFLETFLEWRRQHKNSPTIEKQKIEILETAQKVLAEPVSKKEEPVSSSSESVDNCESRLARVSAA